MAESRLRALEALNASTEPDLAGVSIAGLLECLRVAMRDGAPWQMADPVAELFRRANERTRHKVAVSFHGIEPKDNATVAKTSEAQAESIPATVADNYQSESAELPATVTKKERGYPPEVKRRAVALADAGKPTREIHAAILEACGRAPDISNLARLVRSWRAGILANNKTEQG